MVVHFYERQACGGSQTTKTALLMDRPDPWKFPQLFLKLQETYLFMEVCQVFFFLINSSWINSHHHHYHENKGNAMMRGSIFHWHFKLVNLWVRYGERGENNSGSKLDLQSSNIVLICNVQPTLPHTCLINLPNRENMKIFFVELSDLLFQCNSDQN